jgi:hypothetical protein
MKDPEKSRKAHEGSEARGNKRWTRLEENSKDLTVDRWPAGTVISPIPSPKSNSRVEIGQLKRVHDLRAPGLSLRASPRRAMDS